MTVRARAELSKILGSGARIRSIIARSTCVGQLQVQVETDDGTTAIFIPPGRGIDLMTVATPAQWKKSASFLSAVRMGHLDVKVDKY